MLRMLPFAARTAAILRLLHSTSSCSSSSGKSFHTLSVEFYNFCKLFYFWNLSELRISFTHFFKNFPEIRRGIILDKCGASIANFGCLSLWGLEYSLRVNASMGGVFSYEGPVVDSGNLCAFHERRIMIGQQTHTSDCEHWCEQYYTEFY